MLMQRKSGTPIQGAGNAGSGAVKARTRGAKRGQGQLRHGPQARAGREDDGAGGHAVAECPPATDEAVNDDEEKLSIITRERVMPDRSIRVTSKLKLGGRTLAIFEGASAEKRAEDALKIAERSLKKGVPVRHTTKTVADIGLKSACAQWAKNKSLRGHPL